LTKTCRTDTSEEPLSFGHDKADTTINGASESVMPPNTSIVTEGIEMEPVHSFQVKTLSGVRFKLGAFVFLLAMIPFIVVCIISIIYFQADKRAGIQGLLDTELSWQNKDISGRLNAIADIAANIGFLNESTRKLIETYFQYPDKDNFMRYLAIRREAEHFKQYFIPEVQRILFVNHALNAQRDTVGLIVFSAEKGEVDGKPDVVEDTFDLAERLPAGLLLDPREQTRLSKVYADAQAYDGVKIHDFGVFEGDYSFFITVPINSDTATVHHLPYLPSVPSQQRSDERISSDSIGLLIIQCSPGLIEEALGDFNGIGETFLMGRDGSGQLRLHTGSTRLQSDDGQPILRGGLIPETIENALQVGV
jgi:hypothetical protein